MGQFLSLITEGWPPRTTYSTADIPDLTGKVVIVTGGNGGIGTHIVKALLEHNAKVYIASRDPKTSAEVIKDLYVQTGREAHFLELDLASLKSVKSAAEEFNKGILKSTSHDLTDDGYDLQFGVNVLGHFYFTKLLLPTLMSTAQTTEDKKVRVITTSSVWHLVSYLDFNVFRDTPAKRRCRGSNLYGQSKFGNVVLGAELGRRYGDQGVVSITVNPGNVLTGIKRYLPSLWQMCIVPFMYPTEYGAFTPLWAATSREGADFNGQYLIPWARLGKPHPGTQDPVLGNEFWNYLEEQVANI